MNMTGSMEVDGIASFGSQGGLSFLRWNAMTPNPCSREPLICRNRRLSGLGWYVISFSQMMVWSLAKDYNS